MALLSDFVTLRGFWASSTGLEGLQEVSALLGSVPLPGHLFVQYFSTYNPQEAHGCSWDPILMSTPWFFSREKLMMSITDSQQTGFKGNLRLLIKIFEQPHLPFKILSAALHCWTVLPPPHQPKPLDHLVHAVLTHHPDINHNEKVSFDPPSVLLHFKYPAQGVINCCYGFPDVLVSKPAP